MKKLTVTLYAFALLLIFGALPQKAKAQQSNDSRVLLQGFHWDSHDDQAGGWYNYINSQASTIANAGIDVIWLPPPSDAGSDEGYLPRELNNLTNGYGIEADHLAMLQTLNNLGIEPVADIVVNHRVGSTNWLDFTNPTWDSWSITYDDEVFQQPEYSGYERGNSDTGTAYGPARDIDHTNTVVQNGIISWLNNLKTAGYKGWRYDFVHGFDPYYIKLYNDNTSPTFSVGEDWKGKQEIQDWIDDAQQSSSAFDFPTYYALKAAIKNGDYSTLAFYDSGSGSNQASGLIGWSPAKSVTFIENHDTPRYDPDNNILNGNNIGQAYAYLLTHPGVPTIYWPHYFDWGVKNELDQIIAVRKNNGITNTSSLTIIEDRSDVYAALIDNKVAVKLGYGNWSPSDAGWSDAADYTLQASGNNYAIWAKSGSQNNAPVVYVSPAGPYTSASPFDVTITATDDSGVTPTIYYTTNGDEPTTTNSYVSTTGSVTHNVTSTHTLKVMAIDNESLQSATQTHEYTIASVSTFTVYFKKPSNWGAAMIHYWGAQPTGSLVNTTWPGITMQDASSEYGADWYKQTFSGISSTNLLFHSNSGSQTDDLTTSATSWYDGGWVSEPIDNQAPSVSVNPAGGNYSGTISVTITASDNSDPSPTINYTLNGSSASASNSVTLTISTASTLSFSATDASGNTSASQSHDYTFNPSSDLVIHYRGGLTNPYVYYWSATPNGGASGGWPGDAMAAEGDGWYEFTIPNNDCANIIFSNNGSSQSPDLNRCGEGWYDNGTWYDQKPSGGMTVHFKPNGYSNPEIYFWGTTASTSWPGEQMISEGDGWYYYTFTNDNCANIIFSNNGGSQTADLYRCGDGYYQNGSWSSTKSKNLNGLNTVEAERTFDFSISNYPNPFTTSTTFEYSLPRTSNVSLIIYNMLGQRVVELVNEEQKEGTHKLSFNRTDLKKGMYIYQLITNHKRTSKRMIIR